MTRKVVVTGGASFIGSHLVEALIARGDEVLVLDDMSSGSYANLASLRVQTSEADLRDYLRTYYSIPKNVDVVYHLAAIHGGRGYIDGNQGDISANFAIDQNVFRASIERGVPKIVFASSGCIYPLHLQGDPGAVKYLREEDAGPPYYPDGIYGMAKLSGELTLEALAREGKLNAASCRFFTVYGPRGKENHAIIAMIARAFIHQDPFVLWGDGSALRNWTYVSDIVKGMLASEEILDKEDYFVVNLGTEERTSVSEAVRLVIRLSNGFGNGHYSPSFSHELSKPVGPLNRIASNLKMSEKLGLSPVPLEQGVWETLKWYFAYKDRDYVKSNLEKLLVSR